MERPDQLAEEQAARIERLLENDAPDSADRALVRFAAEQTVAARPDATFEEHEVFLHAKLQEAQLVEDGLAELAAFDSALEDLAETATTALQSARFDDLNEALAEVARTHREPATRVVALCVRADAAFVEGDAARAATHYVAAANDVDSQDKLEGREEAIMFRSRAVGRLIRHADTFGGDGGWIGDAMELCGANIRRQDTHLWNQGARQMDSGAAQMSAGKLKGGYEALDFFMGAEYAFRIASWRFDKDGFPEDWAAAQNARGLAQAQYCFRYPEATGEAVRGGGWISAEACYASAMEAQRNAGLTVPWAKTGINLAWLLVHRSRAARGEAGRKFLQQALDNCREAQLALRPEAEAEVWIDAQLIIVEALLDHADIDPDDAQTRLLQAMTEVTTAQDFLVGEDLPLQEARAGRLMKRLQRQTEVLEGS